MMKRMLGFGLLALSIVALTACGPDCYNNGYGSNNPACFSQYNQNPYGYMPGGYNPNMPGGYPTGYPAGYNPNNPYGYQQQPYPGGYYQGGMIPQNPYQYPCNPTNPYCYQR